MLIKREHIENLKNLKRTKKFFLKLTHLFLKNYRRLLVSERQVFITTWRLFYQQLLFGVLNITVPGMLNSVLLYKHDTTFTEPFIRQKQRSRRVRRRFRVFRKRGMTRYLFFTLFFRRLGILPRVMRKEARTNKWNVTRKQGIKARIRKRVAFDPAIVKELFPRHRFGRTVSRRTFVKFRLFKRVGKKFLAAERARKEKERMIRKSKKNRFKVITSQKLGLIAESSHPFIYKGTMDVKLSEPKSKRQMFLRLLYKNKRAASRKWLFKLRKSRNQIIRRDRSLKQMMRIKTYYIRLRRYKRLLKLRRKGRVKKRVLLRKLYPPRRRWSNKQIIYRVRRTLQRKERRREWRKKKREHLKAKKKLATGKRFWFRRTFRVGRRQIARKYRIRMGHIKIIDFIRVTMLILALIEATGIVVRFYSNLIPRAIKRFYYYKRYCFWFRLRRRRLKPRWHFRSPITKRVRRYRHILFKTIDRAACQKLSRTINARRKHWLVITLKWRKRNFYSNIFSTKHGGGIFKTSNGNLGAKKRHKARFRFTKKSLHYLIRFLIFYRRRLFKRQKKRMTTLYNELGMGKKKKGRLNKNRMILMDTRRSVRTAGIRLTLHLIIEWFGREDRQSVFERFVRRLRKFQIRRRKRRIRRIRKKLYQKGVQFRRAVRQKRIEFRNELFKRRLRFKKKLSQKKMELKSFKRKELKIIALVNRLALIKQVPKRKVAKLTTILKKLRISKISKEDPRMQRAIVRSVQYRKTSIQKKVKKLSKMDLRMQRVIKCLETSLRKKLKKSFL